MDKFRNKGFSQLDIYKPISSAAEVFKTSSTLKDIYKYLYQYCRYTTIHGGKQISLTGRHVTEYFFWSVIMIFSIGMTIYSSSRAWYRYQYNPTVIIMQNNFRDWNISFPSAVICPLQKVNEDALLTEAKKHQIQNVTAFVEFFVKLASSSYTTFSDLPDYKEVSPDLFLNITVAARHNFSYQVTTTLTDEKEDLEEVLTEAGVCYSYNSKIAPFFHPLFSKQNTPLSDLMFFTVFKLKTVIRKLMVSATICFGFRRAMTGSKPRAERSQDLLYCNVLNGSAYTEVKNMDSNYTINLLGPYEVPYIGAPYTSCHNRTFYEFDLFCLPIVSTPGVRELKVSQRKCRTRSDGSLKVSSIYSYNLCLIECRLKYAEKLCKCIPYNYDTQDADFKKDWKICDVEGMKCLGKHGEELEEMREPGSTKKLPCDCLPLCTDYHFILTSSQRNRCIKASKKRKSSIKEEDRLLTKLGQEKRRFRRRKLQAYTASIMISSLLSFSRSEGVKWQMTNYPKRIYQRDIIYSFADLLVSIGGAMGLFLGCSILSIVEIIYYLTLRAAASLMIRKKSKERVIIRQKNSKIKKKMSVFEFLN